MTDLNEAKEALAASRAELRKLQQQQPLQQPLATKAGESLDDLAEKLRVEKATTRDLREQLAVIEVGFKLLFIIW